MAEFVCMVGVMHNPFLPHLFSQADAPPAAATVLQRIAVQREKLAKARPDVLLMIGNDHLHQFFMDNMPAFMIGKMEVYEGTYPDEVREFKLPYCRVRGDLEFSRQLLEGALQAGIDMAYSNELRLDHAIVVPLMWVRPEMDLPIVPVLTNCLAPPLPPPRRFLEVGRTLRRIVDGIPGNQRVGVVVSGHLSLEIGGPRQHEPCLTDPEFDHQAVRWIAENDYEGACEASTFEKLKASGNMTHGFLNFILAMGFANGLKPTMAEVLDLGFPGMPFFAWEPLAETVP